MNQYLRHIDKNLETTSKMTDPYVEFAHEKEKLFDRWYMSQEIEGNYTRLHELLVIEKFRNYLPIEVKTYLDENKEETFHRTAMLADNYTLTDQ